MVKHILSLVKSVAQLMEALILERTNNFEWYFFHGFTIFKIFKANFISNNQIVIERTTALEKFTSAITMAFSTCLRLSELRTSKKNSYPKAEFY